jgi:hypothetical protein
MKNRGKRGAAFQRIKAGLERAIAHAEGREALKMEEVEANDSQKPTSPSRIPSHRVQRK